MTARERLVDEIAELDVAIERARVFVREGPGHPLPGRGGVVAPPPGRVERVGETVAAGRELIGALERRDRLRRELRELDLRGRELRGELDARRELDPRRELDRCERAALVWLAGLRDAEQLLDELQPDPDRVRPRLRPRDPLPPAAMRVARAIIAFRDGRRGGIRRLAELSAVRGFDEDWLAHLLHTGCRLAEAEPDEIEPVVGVLLPVRIETRFDPGTLRLRVVPDEPWFARHDARASEGELKALDRYVAAVAAAPTEEAAKIAWRELAAHTGGARAVWLVRTFVIVNAIGEAVVSWPPPGDLRTEPAFPRIVGLPETLDVWLARGGGAPTRVTTLTIDPARLRTDFPDPDTAERRWWDDWNEAVDAGLATKIPLDGDPNDIDALFVTGLGAEEPAKLFESHRDEGVLGLLRPGTPTNSVDGAPAASLASDPDAWWEVLQTPASDTDRLVSQALTGDPDLFGNLPGDSDPHRAWSATLVAGLWPALWGYAADDVWNLSGGSAEAAAWAPHALFPSGPFPSLRVGSQPYGLLPATSLGRWVPAKGDPGFEGPMTKPLLELVAWWRAAAEGRGNVAGVDTDGLLDLLASVPTAPGYRQRRAWPLELWWLFALFVGDVVTWSTLDAAWRKKYQPVEQLGLDPVRRYGSLAASRRVEIPLIRPPGLEEGRPVGDLIRELLGVVRENPSLLARPEVLELEFFGFALDSVLLRLVIRSLQVVIGDIGRARVGDAPPPDPERLARRHTVAGRLETWLGQVEAGNLRDTPGSEAVARVFEALHAFTTIPEDRLDGLLRATLDTAIYRIDPWVVGLPTRRLQSLADDGALRPRLGVYGWVDHPAPGSPGPTEAGLLFAPSPSQALAAAVIRDRAVNDAEAGRWAMDLTSRTVRDADRIAEHVRVGAHLAEALGREVERVVGDPDDVERLRRDFPVRSAHAGRRTCDGLAVLRADPGGLGLDAAVLDGLVPLRAALNAYGDLLVAEAVHHVAEGRAEAAGAVMDAAAGLARPPRLDLLKTRRPGRTISTSALVVLPGTAAPPEPADPVEAAEQSPATLADATAAAFIVARVGAATAWSWSVVPLDATTPIAVVRLSDLGLQPADALALPLDDLERLVREEGAASLGIVDPAGVEIATDDGSERYERAARLAGVLGRSPATADAATESPDGQAAGGTAIGPELLTRYGRVRATAEALRDRLADALAGTTADGQLGTADPLLLERLLVAARRWGIAPDAPTSAPAGGALPDTRVWSAIRARELLVTRLAPPAPSAAAPVDDVVAALAKLVSPTGQLALLSRLRADDLPALGLSGAAAAVDLDDAWLPVVAGVREALARLEAHQLSESGPGGAGTPFVAWSNRPDDPWQLDPSDARRLVVAFVAPGLDPSTLAAGAPVAAGLVDRFAEFVPAEEQSAGVAFGFDAPAARAPQAILLAVPPDLDTPLDADTVLQIVAETRDLAHARMARPADLDVSLAALLPTVLLPATGQTAISLDPTRR